MRRPAFRTPAFARAFPRALAAVLAPVLAAAPAWAGSEAPQTVGGLVAGIVAEETALAELRLSVRETAAQEQALSEALEAQRAETTRLLAALEAVSRMAGAAPGPHPDGPIAAARAARLLGWLRPNLETEARRVAADLRDLDAARAREETGLAELDAGLARLDQDRAELRAALDARADTVAATPVGLVGMAARNAPTGLLAREADTLSALAARLAALTGAPAAAGDRLPLAWPVVGGLRSGFETPDSAGVRRPGLLLAATPLSVVTAPAAGVVRYAGPFLDYGYVVVLEPRPDVLVLLAGLATLETEAGARVARGDLLGFLGGRAIDAQEYLMQADAGNGETGAETLYIELRHGRGPVDPAPWFAGSNG